MKNWNKICGFLAIFLLSTLFSSAQEKKDISLLTKFPVTARIHLTTITPQQASWSHSMMLISPNYYTQHFGFFCKQELEVEKALKIPFRFRLGSVEQSDYLEGKRGNRQPMGNKQ